MIRLCTVADCGGRHMAKGLCCKHYNSANRSRIKAWKSEWRTKNRELARKESFEKAGIRNGFTPELTSEILEIQNHSCAICKVPVTFGGQGASSAHRDHNHKTGLARGILCAPCNRKLGIFEKNFDKFQEYLSNPTVNKP